ncbi:hypothetical protein B0H16DRAFT_1477050 [Mycena metata]|uniref:NACHT domain-containing protein n=1 Tax=Mycena metata TaxID=1033252 RepID=A0AAD7MGA5_9AGAR|nr:hypothetical protein B0H16DRAFT_1477050 [Mycena metata]
MRGVWLCSAPSGWNAGASTYTTVSFIGSYADLRALDAESELDSVVGGGGEGIICAFCVKGGYAWVGSGDRPRWDSIIHTRDHYGAIMIRYSALERYYADCASIAFLSLFLRRGPCSASNPPSPRRRPPLSARAHTSDLPSPSPALPLAPPTTFSLPSDPRRRRRSRGHYRPPRPHDVALSTPIPTPTPHSCYCAPPTRAADSVNLTDRPTPPPPRTHNYDWCGRGEEEGVVAGGAAGEGAGGVKRRADEALADAVLTPNERRLRVDREAGEACGGALVGAMMALVEAVLVPDAARVGAEREAQREEEREGCGRAVEGGAAEWGGAAGNEGEGGCAAGGVDAGGRVGGCKCYVDEAGWGGSEVSSGEGRGGEGGPTSNKCSRRGIESLGDARTPPCVRGDCPEIGAVSKLRDCISTSSALLHARACNEHSEAALGGGWQRFFKWNFVFSPTSVLAPADRLLEPDDHGESLLPGLLDDGDGEYRYQPGPAIEDRTDNPRPQPDFNAGAGERERLLTSLNYPPPMGHFYTEPRADAAKDKFDTHPLRLEDGTTGDTTEAHNAGLVSQQTRSDRGIHPAEPFAGDSHHRAMPSMQTLNNDEHLHARPATISANDGAFPESSASNYQPIGHAYTEPHVNAAHHNRFHTLYGDSDLNLSPPFLAGAQITAANVNYHRPGETGIHILHRAAALEALYNSADSYPQPSWCTKDNSASSIWLHGPAGAGKSAMMHTLSKRLQDAGCLGGAFFFKRHHLTRGNAKVLFTTLAYQLAENYGQFRAVISEAVERQPSLVQRDMEVQLEYLLVKPRRILVDAPPSRIFLVDGLDECEGEETQEQILQLMGDAVQQSHGGFRFLVASRPESHIREVINALRVGGLINSVNINQSLDDVRMSLHVPTPWPSSEILDHLVKKSSGYFVYASTVIKFVDDSYSRPTERLETLQKLHLPDDDRPFEALDQLYFQMLSRVPARFRSRLCDILQCLVLGITRPRDIDPTLGLQCGDTQLILRSLHSVLKVDTDEDWVPISFHHASFLDFLHVIEFLSRPRKSRDGYSSSPHNFFGQGC